MQILKWYRFNIHSIILSISIKYCTIYPNLKILQFCSWIMLILTCIPFWNPSLQISIISLNAEQLKFDYETITNLQPCKRSNNELNITWIYRKHKKHSFQNANKLQRQLTTWTVPYYSKHWSICLQLSGPGSSDKPLQSRIMNGCLPCLGRANSRLFYIICPFMFCLQMK